MGIILTAINFYPVKGLKGIALEQAHCTDRGIAHDRRWMVVDAEGIFISQRSHPRMATVWTDLSDGMLVLSAPDEDSVEIPLEPPPAASMKVQVWNSIVDAIPASRTADLWLSNYLESPCRLVYMPDDSVRYSNNKYAGDGNRVGFADGYAYLAIGESSLADLNSRLAAKNHPALPMNRFRPNFVLSGTDPYAEDRFGEVRVGSAAFRGVKPCGRCQVTTTDQATGEVTGPEPLLTLSGYRDSPEFGQMFGMNMVSVRAGTVRVGDSVEPA
jgi:uncharacterized protein YcbX